VADDEYENLRSFYGDKSVALTLLATDAGLGDVIVPRTALHTIFVQRIVVTPFTVAAQTLGFQDDNSTPKKLALVPASQAAPWDADYGPKGMPLTQGKNLDIIATAGVGASIKIDAYQKLTGVGAP